MVTKSHIKKSTVWFLSKVKEKERFGKESFFKNCSQEGIKSIDFCNYYACK